MLNLTKEWVLPQLRIHARARSEFVNRLNTCYISIQQVIIGFIKYLIQEEAARLNYYRYQYLNIDYQTLPRSTTTFDTQYQIEFIRIRVIQVQQIIQYQKGTVFKYNNKNDAELSWCDAYKAKHQRQTQHTQIDKNTYRDLLSTKYY